MSRPTDRDPAGTPEVRPESHEAPPRGRTAPMPYTPVVRDRVVDIFADDEPERISGEILTVGEKEYRQRRLLQDLRMAADAEAKMEILAAFLDRYGFDVFIGLIPHVGDGAVTAVASLITFWQAFKAGVPLKKSAKIGAYHLADFLVGQIPVLGDLADLFLKPNEYAAGEVAHRLKTLLDEARAKGVPEDEIEDALHGANEFKRRWNERMVFLKKFKGKAMKALGLHGNPLLEDEHGHGKADHGKEGHGKDEPASEDGHDHGHGH